MLTRRDFLRTTTAAGLAGLAGTSDLSAQSYDIC